MLPSISARLYLIEFFVFIVLTVNLTRANINSDVSDEFSYRLPNNTRPESFDLSLRTWIHSGIFDFTGKIRIGIRSSNENQGNTITLHTRQLTVNKVSVTTNTQPPINVPVLNWNHAPKGEFLTIQLSEELLKNSRYIVDIDYNGTLRGDQGGFYRSSYNDDNGNIRWLATTQFSATNARHAFPCYDEPGIKANYTIDITHDPSYSAISNMPTTSAYPISNPDGSVTTFFQTTPPTSSYLIAFVISDFLNNTHVDNNGIPHRIFSQPNKISDTDFALEASDNILTAISDYLNVSYSLPKIDQIGIPDFAPGAMENWGLVTYKENRLFWNDETSTFKNRLDIASIIAHEYGHQWFGNLVGPRWWTYLWLSEGFATLFGSIGTDLVFPEWNYMDLMTLQKCQPAFLSDELDNAVPMTDYIPNPDAMKSEFSTVSYNKAGCVLRMFMHAFKEENFKKGLKYYLNSRSYDDAAEENLFDAIQQAVNEDSSLPPSLNVRDIMSSWSKQKGFPILKVTRDYENGTISLFQQRYQANTLTIDLTSYWIPYNFITSNDKVTNETIPDDWLPKDVHSSTITQVNQTWSSKDWIVFNKQNTGYYRIQYDQENYNLIADSLVRNDLDKIPLLTRAQLIDDAFSFAKINQHDYQIPLNLLKYLHREIEYIPWASAVKGLTLVNRMFAGNESYFMLMNFIQKQTDPIFKQVGISDLSNEPIQQKYLRNILIHWACLAGSENCHSQTTKQLKEILENKNEFHQNVRESIYCAALRTASVDEYNSVWSRFMYSNDVEYRNNLITALSCTYNKTLLHGYLLSTLTSYNNQSVPYWSGEHLRIFTAVFQSGPKGLLMAMQLLTENMAESASTFGTNNIPVILRGIGQHVVSKDLEGNFYHLLLEAVLQEFVSEAQIRESLEEHANVMNWLELHSKSIYEWVKINGQSNNANLMIKNVSLIGLVLSFSIIETIRQTF